MPYVNLKTLMAGPQGVGRPGQRIQCDEATARRLIESGQATPAGKVTRPGSPPPAGGEDSGEHLGQTPPNEENPQATVGNVTVTYRSPLAELERLGVDSRYVTAAESAGYEHVGDLAGLSSGELKSINGISQKGAVQIQAAFTEFE